MEVSGIPVTPKEDITSIIRDVGKAEVQEEQIAAPIRSPHSKEGPHSVHSSTVPEQDKKRQLDIKVQRNEVDESQAGEQGVSRSQCVCQ